MPNPFYTLKYINYIISKKHLVDRFLNKSELNFQTLEWFPRGVVVKAMDCGIVVREFVLQSRDYIHFRANTFGNGMNPLSPSYGLNSITIVLLGEALALNNLKRLICH